jgi:hypothetical protein
MARGVKTVEACPVTTVQSKYTNSAFPAGEKLLRVTCRGGDRSFVGKSVILATGAWTSSVQVYDETAGDRPKLVPLPDIVPELTAQFYFKVCSTRFLFNFYF